MQVPVPEGLSLSEPFNASALNKLLAMELPVSPHSFLFLLLPL